MPRSYFRSGELAALAGVSADTLRHYERKGLIGRPRRSANNYREYSKDTLERVRLIQSALAIGFTIDELARILKMRDQGKIPCQQVRDMAAGKLEDLEQRIIELLQARDNLRAVLRDWNERISVSKPGEKAYLLENLPRSNQKHKTRALRLKRHLIKR